MLYPDLIVLPGARSLDSLPREDITNGVVSEAFQAGKMDVGIFFPKGTAVEPHIVAVKEVGGLVRRLIRLTWQLRIPRNINTSQDNMSAIPIFELTILDEQAQ